MPGPLTGSHYLTLSRNYGYQLSVLAGLSSVNADLYMVCDVDCEDPPEMLLSFLAKIEEGGDYVYGIRNNRPDPWLLGKMRSAFYLTLRGGWATTRSFPTCPSSPSFAARRRQPGAGLQYGPFPAHRGWLRRF